VKTHRTFISIIMLFSPTVLDGAW